MEKEGKAAVTKTSRGRGWRTQKRPDQQFYIPGALRQKRQGSNTLAPEENMCTKLTETTCEHQSKGEMCKLENEKEKQHSMSKKEENMNQIQEQICKNENRSESEQKICKADDKHGNQLKDESSKTKSISKISEQSMFKTKHSSQLKGELCGVENRVENEQPMSKEMEQHGQGDNDKEQHAPEVLLKTEEGVADSISSGVHYNYSLQTSSVHQEQITIKTAKAKDENHGKNVFGINNDKCEHCLQEVMSDSLSKSDERMQIQTGQNDGEIRCTIDDHNQACEDSLNEDKTLNPNVEENKQINVAPSVNNESLELHCSLKYDYSLQQTTLFPNDNTANEQTQQEEQSLLKSQTSTHSDLNCDCIGSVDATLHQNDNEKDDLNCSNKDNVKNESKDDSLSLVEGSDHNNLMVEFTNLNIKMQTDYNSQTNCDDCAKNVRLKEDKAYNEMLSEVKSDSKQSENIIIEELGSEEITEIEGNSESKEELGLEEKTDLKLLGNTVEISTEADGESKLKEGLKDELAPTEEQIPERITEVKGDSELKEGSSHGDKTESAVNVLEDQSSKQDKKKKKKSKKTDKLESKDVKKKKKHKKEQYDSETQKIGLNSGKTKTKIKSKTKEIQEDTSHDNDNVPTHELKADACEDDDDDDGDSWFSKFDEDGECLDPELKKELSKVTGIKKPTKHKTQFDFYSLTDKQVELDDAYGHIVEIYDFSADLKTQDITKALSVFKDQGYDLKWVDDTHALAVFSSPLAANQAIQMCSSPLLKLRPVSQGIPESKTKAKRCFEFLQPHKPRPKTTKLTAHMLVTGALGVRSSMTKEEKEKERNKLKEAREQKRQEKQRKADIWGD